MRGRVASLLEVGTGFHPELTGRENIYLNGAILGMTAREIRKKFDEIVAFAEVEKFLDTPVKRYSSGMYVRLAFAVAAHLEPEILIVDEVLAVGDTGFQRKCLGKMDAVARMDGRTVLFVSHNMDAISRLCTHGLLLKSGEIVFQGAMKTAIAKYSHVNQASSVSFRPNKHRPSICAVTVDRDALASRDVIIEIEFSSPWPLETAVGGIVLQTMEGQPVWGSNGRFHVHSGPKNGLTHGTLRCEARGLPIVVGEYLLSVWLSDWNRDYDSKTEALCVTVGDGEVDALRPGTSAGYVDWPATWQTVSSSDSSSYSEFQEKLSES